MELYTLVCRALLFVRSSVPAFTDVIPLKVLLPPNSSVPCPALVSAYGPAIVPPTPRVPAVTVTILWEPNVMLPVPRFRSELPANAKSPAHVCALFEPSVTAPPLVLSRSPALIVKRPDPKAPGLFTFRRPAASVVPPECAFAPFNVRVPDPICCNCPVPTIAAPKSTPWVIVSERLNASVALFVIVPAAEREPLTPPLPSCRTPDSIHVVPV